MEENASLLLCNLASQHGLARAREIIAEDAARKAAAVQPAPVVVATSEPTLEPTPEVPAVPEVPQRTPEEQAQRDAEDAGADGATPEQLKQALDGIDIAYPKNASKAKLLALWKSRP